ncbi:hypothetical protein [Mesorhizobium sp.]|uniref:hypothetical protein n=2 Tax=Mesorhizobium sp. TaxID=1871066 RepID=UPI00257CAB17|nr:hypothetical protein [Mesorhizobium sp.]
MRSAASSFALRILQAWARLLPAHHQQTFPSPSGTRTEPNEHRIRSNRCDRPLSSKVEALAGFGLTAADIACVLATDEQNLKATYAHELESGGIKATARVAESLYRKATGEGREAVTAAIFWLKTRARWKETSVHEVEGKLDTSVTFVTTYEDQKLL